MCTAFYLLQQQCHLRLHIAAMGTIVEQHFFEIMLSFARTTYVKTYLY